MNPAATMSQAVIASSASKSGGGARNGSMQSGNPLERNGVQIRTSHISINFFALLTSPPSFSNSAGSIPSASLAKSPCGSMMSEGIFAKAASSMRAFAMTVFPEPVEPSIAACRAKTIDLMSIGSPVSRLEPRNNPLGLNFFFLGAGASEACSDPKGSGDRISSTKSA